LLRGTVATGDALRPDAWVALRDELIAGVGEGPAPRRVRRAARQPPLRICSRDGPVVMRAGR
jgi:hypothetical protein